MRLLLGKRADVAERREPAAVAYRPVPALPRFIEPGAPLPPTGAFLVDIAGEDRVGLLPFALWKPRRPDRLLLRPVEQQRAKAFELSAVAGIDQRVIVEAFGRQDERSAHAARRYLSVARSSRASSAASPAARKCGFSNGRIFSTPTLP